MNKEQLKILTKMVSEHIEAISTELDSRFISKRYLEEKMEYLKSDVRILDSKIKEIE